MKRFILKQENSLNQCAKSSLIVVLDKIKVNESKIVF
jgi:hypothetical protein